jgi:hypothetical protein
MQYAGKQGQVHGNGIYFGFNQTTPYGYNRDYPLGSGVLALMLWKKKDTSISGSYSLLPGTEEWTIKGKKQFLPNCVVAHDESIVLPLGIVVAR